jgi:hypothetical protein
MITSPRFAGITAIAGATVGIAITPFMAAVWAYEPGVVWDDVSLVAKTVGPTLESWGALSFGAPFVVDSNGTVVSASTAYEVYGKSFFLVYLLMLPVVRYVHARYRQLSDSKWENRTWRVLWVALIVATVADAVSYWGVSLPGPIGASLWGGGFGVEILAMLIVLVATTVYGIVSARVHVVPLWASLLLSAIIPIGIAMLAGVITYVPNAVVVPMSFIWAAIGVWVLVAERNQPVIASTPHRAASA